MPDTDPNDKAKQDPPPPAAITEEDVGRIVNSAVTSQLKRLLPTAISEAIGGLKLDEQISAALAKIQPPPTDDKDKQKAGSKTDLEKRLEEMALKLEASEASRLAAEKQRIDTEQARKLDAANTALRAALQPKLRPELLEVAASHWGTVQGRLKLAEDGSPLLRVKRSPYKGAPEQDEDLPLADAIPYLLASEEAKAFLPAPGTADPTKGTRGPRAPGMPGGKPNSDNPLERVSARLAELGMSFEEEFGGS